MKITWVDGSTGSEKEGKFANEFPRTLIEAGHEVYIFKAEKMNIHFCTGCWTCWWKTPGECIHRDDMEQLCRKYLESELVLHYSPVIAGFVTSRLKTINDRTIPLVHPYMAMVQNESHHMKRYEKYPALGLILDPQGADLEELSITRALYARLALNLKSELKLFSTTEKNQEELIDEISRL